MASPFVGEISIVAFDFAPSGWAQCDGQLMSIAQNVDLFSVLGVYYGGDGRTTFGLPDFKGRVPVHRGGLGGNFYDLGSKRGENTVELTLAQLPIHDHTTFGTSVEATSGSPLDDMPAKTTADSYKANVPLDDMNIETTPIGGGSGHENVQPSTVVNFVISLTGSILPRS